MQRQCGMEKCDTFKIGEKVSAARGLKVKERDRQAYIS